MGHRLHRRFAPQILGATLNGKRRQLKMAITWRGSIALRGNLSSRWGRARCVDLQSPGANFRALRPPGCLPPAPKLRTYDRGRPAGGGPSGQGLRPWTPRSARHTGHTSWGNNENAAQRRDKNAVILVPKFVNKSAPQPVRKTYPNGCLKWQQTAPNSVRKTARKCIGIHLKTEGVSPLFLIRFPGFFFWRRRFFLKSWQFFSFGGGIFGGVSNDFQINPDLGVGPWVPFLPRVFQKAGGFFRKWHRFFQNCALTGIKNEPATHQKRAPFCFKNG